MTHTTVRRARDSLGKGPSRRGATVYIPADRSKRVVDFVLECESQNLPVFKGLVIANVNNIIRGTQYFRARLGFEENLAEGVQSNSSCARCATRLAATDGGPSVKPGA